MLFRTLSFVDLNTCHQWLLVVLFSSKQFWNHNADYESQWIKVLGYVCTHTVGLFMLGQMGFKGLFITEHLVGLL